MSAACKESGETGSHFNTSSDLLQPNDKKDVMTSTEWVGILDGLIFVMGL